MSTTHSAVRIRVRKNLWRTLSVALTTLTASACSGSTSADQPGLAERCERFCETWTAGTCTKQDEAESALDDITTFSGCDATACAEFVASVAPEYRDLYVCLLTAPLACGTSGEAPRAFGCDDEAIAAADTFGDCRMLPSRVHAACDFGVPHYCSGTVSLDNGYWPPESPGCTSAGGGIFCCDAGWASLPSK